MITLYAGYVNEFVDEEGQRCLIIRTFLCEQVKSL